MGTEPWGQVQGQSQAGALDQAQLPCPSLPCLPTPYPLEHLANGQNFFCVMEVSWPGSDPTDQGPPEEGGLGSCASPLMPLPPGPSRRDGVAVAVLLLASCPHGVWWVPPLPHQGITNLGILSRTLQKDGMLLHQQAPNSYGPALGLAALGRPGEESSPGPVSWTESWPVGLVWAPTGADGGVFMKVSRCSNTLCPYSVSQHGPNIPVQHVISDPARGPTSG